MDDCAAVREEDGDGWEVCVLIGAARPRQRLDVQAEEKLRGPNGGSSLEFRLWLRHVDRVKVIRWVVGAKDVANSGRMPFFLLCPLEALPS